MTHLTCWGWSFHTLIWIITGLLPRFRLKWPILIGEAPAAFCSIANIFFRHSRIPAAISVAAQTPIILGPFTIAPYLVDHSAYDAYGLTVDAGGKRLFYPVIFGHTVAKPTI